MVDLTGISDSDLRKHVAWLEYEIGLCLEYDLPTCHLEQELTQVRSIQAKRLKINKAS